MVKRNVAAIMGRDYPDSCAGCNIAETSYITIRFDARRATWRNSIPARPTTRRLSKPAFALNSLTVLGRTRETFQGSIAQQTGYRRPRLLHQRIQVPVGVLDGVFAS